MLGIGIGLNRQKPIFNRVDPAVSAFLTATGITGTTEVNAITNLVANLKSYGLWSKMKAIYPFVSDTKNLLSYSEDFSNGVWTKQSGVTVTANSTTAPDGTLTADLVNGTTGTNGFLQAGKTVSGTSPNTKSIYIKGVIGGEVVRLQDPSQTIGFTSCTLTTSWQRFTLTETQSSGGAGLWVTNIPTTGIYVWGAQLEQSSSASTYQPIATTPDNRFVSQFKFNLKDPRDLNAAFRLAFNGTLSYSKQGIKGNGTNTYISTYLNPSTTLTNNNLHFSYYSRTNIKENSQDLNASNNNPATSEIFLTNYGLATNTIYFTSNAFIPNTASYVASDSLGYVIGNTTANNLRNIFKGGIKVATDTSINVTALPNINTNIGARANPIQEYSAKQFAFATIGDGLTDTEAANLYTSVQTFQTALSRQV